MILQSFAIFVPALISGFGIVHLLWKSEHAAALALKIFLGIGIGLGITSCLYFLRLLLFPGQGGYLTLQVLFLIVILIVLFSQKRIRLDVTFNSLRLSRLQVLLGLAAMIVAAIALYYSITFARLAPHGDYDAQAIWNLRARFIYRSGLEWRNAFSPLINRNFHMDYPLLIPLSVVGGWNTLGREVLRIPVALSMLFLFGMAGVIYSTTAYLRSGSQAAIATILLLATPGLLLFSTFQTADIPLTYFFLASAGLLVIAGYEKNRGLLFLSGMMAGLAAWTKNEGLPFIILMIICTIFIFGFRQERRNLSSLLAGMAFPLFTIVLFKALISVDNDLFANNGLSAIISKLFTPTRYIQILTHLASELFQLGNWPISIIVILLVYALIMGLRSSSNLAEKVLVLIPVSQFIIYLFIYVITPHDLEWHLNYSMSRLLIHIFPLGLFSFFLFVNTPESVLTK